MEDYQKNHTIVNPMHINCAKSIKIESNINFFPKKGKNIEERKFKNLYVISNKLRKQPVEAKLKNFDNFKIYFQTPNLSSVKKTRGTGNSINERRKTTNLDCTSMENYYVVYCIDFGVSGWFGRKSEKTLNIRLDGDFNGIKEEELKKYNDRCDAGEIGYRIDEIVDNEYGNYKSDYLNQIQTSKRSHQIIKNKKYMHYQL